MADRFNGGGDEELEPLLSLEDSDGEENVEDREEPQGDEAAGEEGDSQDDEGQGRQSQVGQHAAPPRQSRADRREREESRRRDTENAELRRLLNEVLTRQPTQPMPPAPDPALERMRLEAMTPEERVAHLIQQSQEQFQRQLRMQQVQSFDQNDRVAFAAKVAADPRVARFKDQVETLFQQEMRKGNMLDRETICAFLVGKAVLSRQAQKPTRQQQRGREALDRQRTQQVNGRSDVGTSGGRRPKTAAERLEGITF